MASEQYLPVSINQALTIASKEELQVLLIRILGHNNEARKVATYGLLNWLPKRRALAEETARLHEQGGAEAVSRRDSEDFQRWVDGLPPRDVEASNRRSAERLAAERLVSERRAEAERVVAERRAAAQG